MRKRGDVGYGVIVVAEVVDVLIDLHLLVCSQSAELLPILHVLIKLRELPHPEPQLRTIPLQLLDLLLLVLYARLVIQELLLLSEFDLTHVDPEVRVADLQDLLQVLVLGDNLLHLLGELGELLGAFDELFLLDDLGIPVHLDLIDVLIDAVLLRDLAELLLVKGNLRVLFVGELLEPMDLCVFGLRMSEDDLWLRGEG